MPKNRKVPTAIASAMDEHEIRKHKAISKFSALPQIDSRAQERSG
ncbi:MAG: hypothetical protein Q4D85_00155 [Corynebacterium sp.]|nr:hypothetical protein [Corynebacterium sp.]MDO5097138.1 hypothetical protein [Corynebacterium sp.]